MRVTMCDVRVTMCDMPLTMCDMRACVGGVSQKGLRICERGIGEVLSQCQSKGLGSTRADCAACRVCLSLGCRVQCPCHAAAAVGHRDGPCAHPPSSSCRRCVDVFVCRRCVDVFVCHRCVDVLELGCLFYVMSCYLCRSVIPNGHLQSRLWCERSSRKA